MTEKISNTIPTVWAGRSPNGRRGLRLLPGEGGYFAHVTSRAVHQRFLLEEEEKAMFVDLMGRWADFSGITVLTHCVMSNHFHMLVWVPPTGERSLVSRDELVRRMQQVWPAGKVAAWERYYAMSPEKTKAELRGALTRRMHNLPAFMRVVKQSFSVWYNARHQVSGTFWEGRYRSLLVEDAPESLFRVASYIDLNPVRAGITVDPAKYLWSGFGAASVNKKSSKEGLRKLLVFGHFRLPGDIGQAFELSKALQAKFSGRPPPWDTTRGVYNAWLHALGQSLEDAPNVPPARRDRPGFSKQQVSDAFSKLLSNLSSAGLPVAGKLATPS